MSDIFNLEIMVLYESGFAGVPDWWTVGHESPLVDKDGSILLIFAEGFLPGWNVVEKNVCSCRIPVDSIQMVKLILSYKKIEGECRFTREERLISPLRFAQLLDTQGGICV